MPKAILDKLPAKAREIYEGAWKDAKNKGLDDAQAGMRAIGAVKQAGFRKNETTGKWTKMSEAIFAIFGEPVNDGEWLEVACTGTVVDMNGHKVSISDTDLDRWVNAFEEDKRGQEIPITFDHPKTGGKAAGWMRGLRKGPKRAIRGANRTTLLMKPEWTPDGKESIENKDYRYFSVEILPENILRAVSLVNFPAVKGMRPATEPAMLGEYYLQEFYMAETQMKCAECGGPIPEGAKACPSCGAKLEEADQDKEKKVADKKLQEEPKVVSLEEFNALRTEFDAISSKREEQGQTIAKLQETAKQSEAQSKKLAELVEAQEGQITGLVDLNNMLRLHEKVTDFMQLGEGKLIAPAYEEQIINLLLMAESIDKEQETLDLLGALAKGEALVPLGEIGTDAVPAPLVEGGDVTHSKMAEQAAKISKDEGISYKEALLRLSRKEGK